MRAQLEQLATVVVGLAALGVGTASVHREFFSNQLATHLEANDVSRVEHFDDLVKAGRTIGDSTAPIKIVEFSDLECPICRTFNERIQEVITPSSRDVALVFVHFPLPMHRFARPAARAAECANDQSRFGKFIDIVYAKQDSLGLKSWGSFAAEAGISDTIQFVKCTAGASKLSKIEEGLAAGTRIKVQGTPTVVINGWRFRN